MKFLKYIDNKLKIKTKQNFVTIIGETPSKGARSPILWNNAYKRMKIKKIMLPLDVRKKNLKKLVLSLKANPNFFGSAVTMPYKTTIIKYIDEIDKDAKKIGSINTIVKYKNKLIGYNTDYMGSTFTLKLIKKNIKKILILGAGGAAKACILSTRNLFKNSKFYFYNRNFKKLNLVLKKIKIKKNYSILKKVNDIKNLKSIDLVINTTSVGFDSKFRINNNYYNLIKRSPVGRVGNKNDYITNKIQNDYNLLKLNQSNIYDTVRFFVKNPKVIIFDIIYNPRKTILIQLGEIFELRTINGLSMNLMQAVFAFKLVNKINNLNQIKKGMIGNGQ